jgi:hypothetical protein
MKVQPLKITINYENVAMWKSQVIVNENAAIENHK